MTTANAAEIYEQLRRLIEAGDEGAARGFLIERIKDFPPDMQGAIAMALLEEGLEDSDDLTVVKQDGAKAMSFIRQMDQALKDKLAVSDIKESL